MVTKESKNLIIDDLKKKIISADAIYVTNLVGANAEISVSLRKKVREAGGSVSVARNTLIARAAMGTYAEALLSDLSGPNAIAFSFKDPAAVARAVNDFKKESEVISLSKGYLGTKVLDKNDIEFLANLPGRDQMLGTLLATFMAPASAFVRVLNAIKDTKSVA